MAMGGRQLKRHLFKRASALAIFKNKIHTNKTSDDILVLGKISLTKIMLITGAINAQISPLEISSQHACAVP